MFFIVFSIALQVWNFFDSNFDERFKHSALFIFDLVVQCTLLLILLGFPATIHARYAILIRRCNSILPFHNSTDIHSDPTEIDFHESFESVQLSLEKKVDIESHSGHCSPIRHDNPLRTFNEYDNWVLHHSSFIHFLEANHIAFRIGQTMLTTRMFLRAVYIITAMMITLFRMINDYHNKQ